MPNEDIKSVLVIGLNRSGTKWLSNLIASHPDVYAVQHPAHFGILESNVFNDFFKMFPKLDSVENRIAFQALWKETDFVKIMDIDLPLLMKDHEPECIFSALRLMMNAAAKKRGCKLWLQKCSPVQMAAHRNHFTASQNVYIHRRFDDVLVSAIENSKSAGRKTGGFRLVLNFCLQSRMLRNISRHSDAIHVSYEKLKDNPPATIAKVYKSLGLKPVPYTSDLGFKPNTSFSDSKRRSNLSFPIKVFKNTIFALLTITPPGVPFRIWWFLRSKSHPSLLRGTFRVTHKSPEE